MASARNVLRQGLPVEVGCMAFTVRAYNTLINSVEKPSAILLKQQKEPHDGNGSREESHVEDTVNCITGYNRGPDTPQLGHVGEAVQC